MSLIPGARPVIRYAARATFHVYLLCVAFLLVGYARQSRSVADGVFSAAQATRGQQLYKDQCAECHGNALEGTIGSPLAGESFLTNWSERPLAGLVDKVQKTMPFNSPGSLSRQQSTDLAAYILQFGKFPAGRNDLDESMLAQIVFPAARRPTAGGISSPTPQANLAELMRAIAFPNSNIIFNLQVKDPGKEPKKQPGTSFDYVEWGSTVYPGWLAVDQAAVAIMETAPLLLAPGRRCQNGKPAPVDRADWKRYVAALEDVGKLAYKESKARNYAAFTDVAEKLNDACANCHKVYRDKGGTEGSGAIRCQP
jgi:mono/diheme cytochrome c family protein